MTSTKQTFLSVMLISGLLLFNRLAFGNHANFSLELHNANLTVAIQVLAKMLNINILMSSKVSGTVTLHLRHAVTMQAFDLLLSTHGLAKWQSGNIWYIAPYEDLIKHQQEELQWQAIKLQSSQLVTRLFKIEYGKAQDIARFLQNEHASLLSKRGQLRVDTRTNIIYIQDIMEKVQHVKKLIQALDVPVKQILIEARLASVDNDVFRELGLHFSTISLSQDRTKVGQTLGGYSLAVAKLADGSLLDVKLKALENEGRAELISSPSLFTANQQAASIESGEEVPYQEVSESGGTAVVFKKAVLGLRVTPQVLPGDKVLLHLQINQDRPSHRIVLGMPTISTRQILTHVLIQAGQTIVLGGIYEINEEKGEEHIPFISDIPFIGMLFKLQTHRSNKRELLIFVTPKIVK